MLKFMGFRASFDFVTGKQRGLNLDLCPESVTGAYKSYNADYNGGVLTYNPSKKLTPSMVKLPLCESNTVKASKSTGDLTNPTSPTINVTRSLNDLSLNTQALSKNQLNEQRKIEKQRILEQKKQEKIAIQERKRREKLEAQERKNQEKLAVQERKKQEKLAAQERQRQEKIIALEAKRRAILAREQAKADKQKKLEPENKQKSKNKTAPNAPQPTVNQQSPNPVTNTSETEAKQRNPTQTNQASNSNTLESSISKSSGPPPYGEFPEIVTDNTNITFGKPVTDSSWDLISQHREQMSKSKTAPSVPQRKKDLQYNVGNLNLV